MAQLDKLIEKIQAGHEIILESGKPPVLKSESGSAPMLSQQLSISQLTGLIQEIAPVGGRELIAQHKQAKFEYAIGGKTVTVVCGYEGEQLTAKISMDVRNGNGAAPERQSAAKPEAVCQPS